MPLSPEDQALIDRTFSKTPYTRYGYVAQNAAVEVGRAVRYAFLIARKAVEAARAEERAKAEGEVEEAFRALEGRDEKILALEQRVRFLTADRQTAESNLAKAEARIADVTRERDAAEHRIARMVVEDTRIADLQAALSRATQAEELVREVVEDALAAAYEQGCLDVQANYRPDPDPEFGEAARDYAIDAFAKLKAAPLQGEGSSSASGVESAARLASQVCDPNPPSSTGGGE